MAKKTLALSLTMVLIAGLLAVALPAVSAENVEVVAAAESVGTTYYVSISLGNDNNPGTEAAPLKTLLAVNALNLGPGDSVLFKSGEVWHGQLLFDGYDSGAPGNPIQIGMWGGDPADKNTYPSINAMGGTGFYDDGVTRIGNQYPTLGTAVGPGTGYLSYGYTGAVIIQNCSDIEIRNLEITNDNDFIFANNNPSGVLTGYTLTGQNGTGAPPTTGNRVRDYMIRWNNTTNKPTNSRDGVVLLLNADEYHVGGDDFRMERIVIEDNYIHSVDGLQFWPNGSSGGGGSGTAFKGGNGNVGDDPYFGAGLLLHQVGSSRPGMTINDVTIRGNLFFEVGTMGIASFNFADAAGGQTWTQNCDRLMKDIYIGYNYFDKILGGMGDICNVDGSLVEYNAFNRWGWKYPRETAGLYTWMGNNVTYANNIVANGVPNTGSGYLTHNSAADNAAFDIDSGLYNVIHEFNYTYHNGCGTFGYLGRNYGTIFRYNVADRDERSWFAHGWYGPDYGDQWFLNNTIYFDDTAATTPSGSQTYQKTWTFCSGNSQALSDRLRAKTTYFANNLFYSYGHNANNLHYFSRYKNATTANNWGRSTWLNNYFYFADGQVPANNATNGYGPWYLNGQRGYGSGGATNDVAEFANANNVAVGGPANDPKLTGVSGTTPPAVPPGLAAGAEQQVVVANPPPIPTDYSVLDLSNPYWANFKPLPGSPLIDAGVYFPEMGDRDFLGEHLYYGSAPDIGAFEYNDGGPRAVLPTREEFYLNRAGSGWGGNVAREKPVTSKYGNAIAYYLTDGMVQMGTSDGYTITDWNSGNGENQWIEIDFGKVTPFNQVRIYEWVGPNSGANNRPGIMYYTYSGWDGTQWVPFYDYAPNPDRAGANNNAPSTALTDNFPRQSNFSKLRIDMVLSGITRIQEIEVYNNGTGVETAEYYTATFNNTTLTNRPATGSATITFTAAKFNRLDIAETTGNLIKYSVEANIDGKWVPIHTGGKILNFDGIIFNDLVAGNKTTGSLRLSWEATGNVNFSRVTGYYLNGIFGNTTATGAPAATLEARYRISDATSIGTIPDSSGGTVRNMQGTGVRLVPDPDGKRGQVLEFGWTSAGGVASSMEHYLTLTNANWPTSMNSRAMTISMWVRPQGSYVTPLGASHAGRLYTLFNKGTTLQAQMYHNGLSGGIVSPFTQGTTNRTARHFSVTDPKVLARFNQWNHLVFTWDGFYYSVWVNGVRSLHLRVNSPAGATTALAPGANALYFGNLTTTGNSDTSLGTRSPYFGFMDDIELYSGVLTDAEIRAMSQDPKVITEIKITTPPTKVVYAPGDSFDTAGLVVTATYANGDTAVLSEDAYEVRNALNLSLGVNDVTVALKLDDTIRDTWSVEIYTITYNYDGATGGNSVASKILTRGQPFGELPVPTKDYNEFGGWFLDTALTIPVTAETLFTNAGDTTINAAWIPVDRSDLEAALARLAALVPSQWTPPSLAAIQPVVLLTQGVYDDPGATQLEVDAAAVALNEALDSLVPVVFNYGTQPASVVLRKGMTYQININTNNLENIFYVSGNANATVSPTGLVTAVKTGTAIITVIDAWSQQYFTIAINITS